MHLKRLLKGFRFSFFMVPVFWSFTRDLVWEDLPWDETRTNYLLGKANAYDRADFLEKSVGVYKGLLKSDSNSIAVLLNLGGLYYRRGIFEKAIPCYEKVIRLNPKHYLGHYWLAMCFRKLQRFYAAINTLEEIIEFLPTFKDALNLMGECYERIGEGAKAEHYYLKAMSANPDLIIMHGGVLGPQAEDKRMEERIKH